MSRSERFKSLFPTTSTPAQFTGWEEVENALEAALPDDYKWLIENLGGGIVDHEIRVFAPQAGREEFDIVKVTHERRETLAMIWGEFEEERPPWLSTEDRLVQWADTDSGICLHFLYRSGKRTDEGVTILEQARDGEWEYHDRPCVDFLIAALESTLDSEFFPSFYLPSSPHSYESYEEAGLMDGACGAASTGKGETSSHQ